MMRGLRPIALLCALSLAAAPAFAEHAGASQTTATGKVASHANMSTKARGKALLAFQRDLVSVLAPRADPLPLLGAALLARPLIDPPKTSGFHSLIDRAVQAAGADAAIGAAINWTRLADCDPKADACPNTSALDQLVLQAPNNAAVWMLKLGTDAHNLKHEAAREDLSRAAAAKLYDDYAGISLQALAGAVGVLPPPAGTLDPNHAAGAAGVQVLLVYGLASAQPQPGLRVVAQLCENAGDDASIKADCLTLGKTLEWGSSPLARSLGLHLREILADDPAQREDARRARVNLVWQVQNFALLSARAQGDASLAQHLLVLARHGGTEMSVLLAALRDANIPTDAPADWKPPHQAG
ncbi:MAG: hypothetical protein EPN49_09335 [Rhodanobacter sp.]|nr:MAG: hypothetical protein EPN49_09335 [Rhodanobacter sp.]